MKIEMNNTQPTIIKKIIPFDLNKAMNNEGVAGVYIDNLFTSLNSFKVFSNHYKKIIVGDIQGLADGIYSWTIDGVYLGAVDILSKSTSEDSENNLVLQVEETVAPKMTATLQLENEDDIALITALLGSNDSAMFCNNSFGQTYAVLYDAVHEDVKSPIHSKYEGFYRKQLEWLRANYAK